MQMLRTKGTRFSDLPVELHMRILNGVSGPCLMNALTASKFLGETVPKDGHYASQRLFIKYGGKAVPKAVKYMVHGSPDKLAGPNSVLHILKTQYKCDIREIDQSSGRQKS